eukprot:403349261
MSSSNNKNNASYGFRAQGTFDELDQVAATAVDDQNSFSQNQITIAQADTVVSAIISSMEHLPPTATVEQCIKKYIELKMNEVKAIDERFQKEYHQKLNSIQQYILSSAQNNEFATPPQTLDGYNMDSNNYLIRKCFRKCCVWGKKTPIEYTKPYEGGPTPLLRSPQKRFYIAFTLINLILFIVLFIMYIVQFKVLADETPDCVQLDSIYIQVIVFAAVNTLWYIQLSRIEYASDQEWSKYMTFTAFDIVAQLISVVITLYFSIVRLQDANQQSCYDDNSAIFIQIFVVIGINAVILVTQVTAIVTLSIQLFGQPKRFFYFKHEKDVKIRL